jgi:hypothetical protein
LEKKLLQHLGPSVVGELACGQLLGREKNVTPVLFLFASFSGSLEFSELYMQHGFREFQGCIHSAGMSFSYCLMKNERLL